MVTVLFFYQHTEHKLSVGKKKKPLVQSESSISNHDNMAAILNSCGWLYPVSEHDCHLKGTREYQLTHQQNDGFSQRPDHSNFNFLFYSGIDFLQRCHSSEFGCVAFENVTRFAAR